MTDEERRRMGNAPGVQTQAGAAQVQPVQQTQAGAVSPVIQPVATQQTGAVPAVQMPMSGADAQISSAYESITGTKPYSYNLDGDALYQQYRDRYIQNAKRSMRDTMGQAASLTGGYGNTYGQWVGQQAYDETMRGLTDLIPELEERAYNRQQQSYSTLSSSILTTGYNPTDAELQASGMTREQADAMRQAWIASNPAAAWMQGLMTADQYYMLTGRMPPGAPGAKGSGGGGGGGGGGRGRKKAEDDSTGDGKDQGTGSYTAEYLRYLESQGMKPSSQLYQAVASQLNSVNKENTATSTEREKKASRYGNIR